MPWGSSLATVHGLLPAGFSRCEVRGLGHVGFSSCDSQALKHRFSGCGAQASVVPRHVDSFWTRDRTCASCIAGGFFTTEPLEKTTYSFFSLFFFFLTKLHYFTSFQVKLLFYCKMQSPPSPFLTTGGLCLGPSRK